MLQRYSLHLLAGTVEDDEGDEVDGDENNV